MGVEWGVSVEKKPCFGDSFGSGVNGFCDGNGVWQCGKFSLIASAVNMSISPYPDDWSDLAAAIKHEAGWRCTRCGVQCIKPGEKAPHLSRSQRMARALQVHHWNRNPADNRRENLVALCTGCHLSYHQGGRSNVSPGQLSLW